MLISGSFRKCLGPKKICGASILGKKVGPNIIFWGFLYRELILLNFFLSLRITLFQMLF